MASKVCAYFQAHQLVYIKDVQFFVYQLYFNKAILINKKYMHGKVWEVLHYYFFFNLKGNTEK